MKKLFTLLTLLLCVASSAWADEVGDLVAISSDWTFIADDITSNGTTKLTANTLYCNGKIFAPTANSVAANKGNSTIGGVSHLNSLRLKNTQDQLCFKVSGACTVTFYTQSHSSRGIQAGTTAGGTDLGTQSVSTTEWVLDLSKLKAETTVYLSSFGGDFYFAGFVVTFPGKSYAMQVGVDDESHGTATVSSTSVKEGASVTFRAFENVGWKFKNWTKTGSDPIEIVSTANPYVIEAVTGAISLTANFEEATTHTVTISAGETGALGNYYDNIVVTQNEGTTVTLPIKNSYFYKEGYTATGWTDGTNDYEFGEVITLNKDYAIYPKFELNGAALGDEVTTVTWDLSRSVADKMHIEGTKGYVVTTAQVGTATIDVPSYWDNSDGKLDNRSRTDAYAQVNAGSKFTIPAIKGMTVTLTASNKISATLAGEDMTATTDSPYTATYTYEGDDNTVEIVINDGKYFSTIVAEYPFTGIPGPAEPENTILVATITWDGGSVSNGKWVSADNENYKFSGTTKRSNTTYFKITAGTYTINVPSDIAISSIAICGYSKSNDGTPCQVGETSKTFTTATSTEVYDIAIPTAGADVTFTTSSKEMDIIAIYLYSEDGLTLTTTASMQGWRTFYDADNSYTVDENTKVYVATQENDGKVTLTEYAAGVPAGTPVILKTSAEAENDGTFKMTLTKTTETITPTYEGESLLKVTPFEGNVYRLGSKNGEVGFFPFNATGAAAGIVVLNIDSSNAGARGLTFSFADDEATAIHKVNDSVNLNKVVFDLQGRRVLQPGKGLYIVNGKKVVIK